MFFSNNKLRSGKIEKMFRKGGTIVRNSSICQDQDDLKLVFIVATRPEPAYGRQGLDWIVR